MNINTDRRKRGAFGLKKTLILSFLFGLLCFSFSIAGQNQWFKALGGGNYDWANFVIQTSDGGIVVAGETRSFGAGISDFLLSKFDPLGNHLWTITLGGYSDDFAHSVTEISDGGLVMIGYTSSFGAGYYDLLIAKLDASGNHLWTRTLGGAELDGGYSAIQTSDGGIAVLGVDNSFSEGGDILLAKLDSLGNPLWTKTLGGEHQEWARVMIQVSDGGFVITGETRSFGAGGGDLFLAKFDSLGSYLWSRTVGGSELDRGYSVTQTSDGGLVATGATKSFGIGDYDLLLVKFDSLGNHLWSRTLGGSGLDAGNFVIQASDGGLVVTGVSDSYGLFIDILLAKFDPMGNLLWSRILGRGYYWVEFGTSVIQDFNEGFVVTGFGELAVSQFDILLARFDPSGNTCMGEFITPSVVSVSPTITCPTPSVESISPTITTPTPIITSSIPTGTTICSFMCGDVNGDGVIDIGDVIYLINYLFIGGPDPDPLWVGDSNCDGIVDIGDVIYLINYLFIDGPPPCEP